MTTPFLLRRIYDLNGSLTAPLSCSDGSETISCRVLLAQAAAIAAQLPSTPTSIAFVAHRTLDFVRCQWAIWLANHIAVPISPHSIARERQHIVTDSCTTHVLVRPRDAAAFAALDVAVLNIDAIDLTAAPGDLEALLLKDIIHDAMLLYTSGTTGAPKGVLTTHATLDAQVSDLVASWALSASDRVLHFLPLHHIHGIMNNLLAPLCAGATVECLPAAAASAIWETLARPTDGVTVLMAVPSIYMLLLEALNTLPGLRDMYVRGAQRLRLAISGSMACPISILDRWASLTGHSLLERYGMTECGMALGNPLVGSRHVGYVGQPFPSVEARIGEGGALEVRGQTLFKGYWNRPEETAKAWTDDGWFKTGDVAEYNADLQSYRILGRASVDIIKSAGYKLSALEIERVLLEHPQVRECAVYGVENETWGQIVTTVMRTADDIRDVADLKPSFPEHLKINLAKYKIPRVIHIVESIPKNAMGKINKKMLPSIFDTPVPAPHA
ncbi:acyl-CoA synthetase [Achlya hypogyna]|uniref:Acyl-CoA synthetase n=1 Tax=Achlya hypogyna TaxID=1202772 RepID=A0A1V9Z3R6_ACHHY|nr:acyl-CoA synthetase [Achlya hypogyna]